MGDVSGEPLFEAETPLGFRVRVTHRYWELIVSTKHPVMLGREAEVAEVWHPDEIRVSRGDPQVFLFYKRVEERRWLCAVAKRLEDEGFLVTTYPTDAIKEGVTIWQK